MRTINNTKKIAIAITMIGLICKAIGFLKNSILAYYYGSSEIVDAYVTVFAIGNIVFGWMGGVTGNFIPVYTSIREKKGLKEADSFTNNLTSWLIIITIFVTIVFQLCGKYIVKLVAPGFPQKTIECTITFWRVYCFSLVFSVIYRIYKEYLNSKKLFIQAAAPDLLMSVMIIGAIVVSAYTNSKFLIMGYVIAIMIEAIMVYFMSIKNGHRVRVYFSVDDNIKMVLRTSIPIFLGDCLTEINTFIDKMFASNLQVGSVAVLDYSGTLKNLFVDVGIIALSTMIYPKMSEQWAKGEQSQFIITVSNSIKLMLFFFVPITMSLFLIGNNIVQVVFQRGAFNSTSTSMTTTALYMYSTGLVAVVCRLILNKAFLAMQKTKVVLVTSIVNVTVNVVMNYVLVGVMGHNGLALSTSLAAIAVTVIYLIYFIKILSVKKFRGMVIYLTKILASTMVMTACVYLIKKYLLTILSNNVLSMLLLCVLCVFVGCVVYVGFLKLVNLKELNLIVNNKKR